MISMRTLLLQLPLNAPGPQASYGAFWISPAGIDEQSQPAQTPLSLLPRPERRTEVVLMLPALAVSWHRVSLPPGLGRTPARLLAALHGLLEERLLHEPQQVQLALAPGWQAGQPTWVAACDRGWLLAHLQALEACGLTVQRIVPELAPPTQGEVWHALGNELDGWLWCCSAEHGVCGWPVEAAAHLPESWLQGRSLLAEPSLAKWAQARTGVQIRLVNHASHWREALETGWNLGQFEMQSRLHSGLWQRLRRLADGPLRQPRWRAARWGLAALLLVQLTGLQAWAWKTQQQWQDQQAQSDAILQQSFPQVKLVVDAPLQMAREVERLRQASGQLAAQDFEAQLQALGQALPAGVNAPARLIYLDGQLHWPATEGDASAMREALRSKGYQLLSDGQRWRLQALGQEVRP